MSTPLAAESTGRDDDRSWFPHVTVATVVARDGRFLMVEERARGQLVLNQPAGHLEPGESLQAAALRETLEETGWTVELEHLLGVQQWTSPRTGSHFVRLNFAARPLVHDERRTLDQGIVRALWMSRADLAAEQARLRSPLVLDSIDDWLSGRRLPLDAVRLL